MKTATTTHDGTTYSADLSSDGSVTLYVHRDGAKVLAGVGTFGRGGIEDCAAGVSDEVYDALDEALAEAVVSDCAAQDAGEQVDDAAAQVEGWRVTRNQARSLSAWLDAAHAAGLLSTRDVLACPLAELAAAMRADFGAAAERVALAWGVPPQGLGLCGREAA